MTPGGLPSTARAAANGRGATKRVRLAPAARRAQILAAAREVFVESGFMATRAKDIAERAGITEAFLYRRFSSKDEIFRLAVEEPLLEFLRQLNDETNDLAGRDDVSPLDVLNHFHELLLGYFVDMAPLLAAAVFADTVRGRDIYGNVVIPKLREAVRAILAEVTPSPAVVDEELFVDTLLGVHFAFALESMLDEEAIDVPRVGRQLAKLLSPSLLATPER